MRFNVIITTLALAALAALVNFGEAAVTSKEAKTEARLSQLEGVSRVCRCSIRATPLTSYPIVVQSELLARIDPCVKCGFCFFGCNACCDCFGC